MFYNFRRQHIPEIDAMLYEVVKVHDPPLHPFVSVIFRFSEVGHRPFFTHLFQSLEWGTHLSDLHFLQNLWRLLIDDGTELDLDALFTEYRNQIGRADPLLYRRPLEEVTTRLLTRTGLETTQLTLSPDITETEEGLFVTS